MPVVSEAMTIVIERVLKKKICRKCGAINPPNATKCRRCKSTNLRMKNIEPKRRI
ncbi:MAG: 50S ribosomal protein L40e [Sulfolobales archaeon]|jgi:large subunit ribosomal protein L40e